MAKGEWVGWVGANPSLSLYLHVMIACITLHSSLHPDMTFAVDWTLKNNYQSIYHSSLVELQVTLPEYGQRRYLLSLVWLQQPQDQRCHSQPFHCLTPHIFFPRGWPLHFFAHNFTHLLLPVSLHFDLVKIQQVQTSLVQGSYGP